MRSETRRAGGRMRGKRGLTLAPISISPGASERRPHSFLEWPRSSDLGMPFPPHRALRACGHQRQPVRVELAIAWRSHSAATATEHSQTPLRRTFGAV